jgi:cell fate regulator YaaT (PSP1 superfamily)
MPRVVCVCFRRAGKSYHFDAGHLDLKPGDKVVARTARGSEIGTVRGGSMTLAPDQIREELKPVLRKANEGDLRGEERNLAREREAMEVAARKIAEHGLDMKLIEAEATLDGSRIVLHFSAEGRVDFRALVRDLARALRTRVELHQVGVRDEAKMRGGLGHCGRPLCCATFLTDFDPVGIRMAKEQELSLNPQKISGVCGRLMCCLNFEYDFYRQARACLPKTGSRIETEQGPGRITEIDVVQDRVTVTLDEGGKMQLPTAAVARHKAGCPHSPEGGPACSTPEPDEEMEDELPPEEEP